MTDIKKRVFTLRQDTLEVNYVFDADSGLYFGDFPDFSETPRYTPCGRPWVNVTYDGCPYAEVKYGDCGSCQFFVCEKQGDLIGICENENLRKEDTKNEKVS